MRGLANSGILNRWQRWVPDINPTTFVNINASTMVGP